MQVEVIGHQWWWEFRYPELGVVTANELHVPVGRTVTLKMKTADVLHSFWLPQLAGQARRVSRTAPPRSGSAPSRPAITRASAPSSAACSTGGWGSTWRRRARRSSTPTSPGCAARAPVPADATAPTPTATASAGATVDRRSAARSRPRPAPRGAPRTPRRRGAGREAVRHAAAASAATRSMRRRRPKMIGPNLANVGRPRGTSGRACCSTRTRTWPAGSSIPQSVKHGILMQPMGAHDGRGAALVAYLRTHR